MRKRRQMLGLIAACALAFTGSFAGYAAPVNYDYTADASEGGQTFNFDSGETVKLFPGDGLYGTVGIYLGGDNAASGTAEAQNATDDYGVSYWKNKTASVYQVTDITPQGDVQTETPMVQQTDEAGNPVFDEAGNPVMIPDPNAAPAEAAAPQKAYQLDTIGYVIEAVGGKSSSDSVTDNNSDPSVSDLSAAAEDGSTTQITPDAKYYAEGTQVTLTADPAPEGQQFAGWSVQEIEDDGTVAPVSDLGSLGIGELNTDSVKTSPLTFTMGRLQKVLVFSAQYATAENTDADTADQSAAAAADASAQQPSADTEQTSSDASQIAADASADTAANAGQPDVVIDDSSADAAADVSNGQEAAPVIISVSYLDDQLADSTGAYPYAEGFAAHIATAQNNAAGQVFDHWETSDPAVTFADQKAVQTDISASSAPAANVTVTPVYVDAASADPGTEVTADVPVANAGPYTITTDNTIASVKVKDADAAQANSGDTVVVTAMAADAGKAFDGFTVKDADGTLIDVSSSTDKDKLSASFTMPEKAVTVAAHYADVKPVQHSLVLAAGSGAADAYTSIKIEKEDGTVLFNDKGANYSALSLDAGSKVKITLSNTSAKVGLTAASGNTASVQQNSDGTYTVTIPADADASLVYSASETYQVTVSMNGGTVGGKGSGSFISGTAVDLAASVPAGKLFNGWTVTGDSSLVTLADASQPQTTLTVAGTLTSSGAVTVVANYKDVTYNLTVTNGTGAGQYAVSTPATIVANAPQAGYRFSGWSLVSGTAAIADAKAATTTVTLSSDAAVQANYELIPYTITVKNGKPSGSYTVGQEIDLEPNYPASGKEFDKWSVTSGKISIDDKNEYYTVATVKASDATVTALYKNGPSPDSNTINGLQNDMEYLKSSTLTFNAVGAGMDNKDPNPGDYRYRPTGYQIGSVTRSWNNAPYQTSMAINAVGDYTLIVTYAKEVYDGSAWKADGTTDTKSIMIHVVNTLSVQTGDNSPIIPLILVAAAAFAAIIVLVVVRKRSRR